MNKNGDITLQDIKDAVELIQNVCLSRNSCISAKGNCPLFNEGYDLSESSCIMKDTIPELYRLEDIK